MHFHSRADFQRHNPSMPVGKRSSDALSPTIHEEKTSSYSVRIDGKVLHCKTKEQVNNLLLRHPYARVVKTVKTVTTTVTHKRIK